METEQENPSQTGQFPGPSPAIQNLESRQLNRLDSRGRPGRRARLGVRNGSDLGQTELFFEHKWLKSQLEKQAGSKEPGNGKEVPGRKEEVPPDPGTEGEPQTTARTEPWNRAACSNGLTLAMDSCDSYAETRSGPDKQTARRETTEGKKVPDGAGATTRLPRLPPHHPA